MMDHAQASGASAKQATRRLVRMIMPVALVVGLMIGCGTDEQASVGGHKPTVVASIYPLASLSRALVGESAEVMVMLPPGQSPHGYEPDARAMGRLAEANAVVMVGMGLDPWANRASAASGGAGRLFVVADHIHADTSDTADTHDHAHDHEHADASHNDHADHGSDEHSHDHDHHAEQAHDHGHDHAHGDPHLWLDPVLIRRVIAPLAETLAEALPEEREAIEKRAAELDKQLRELDADYQQALAPYEGRSIITYHSAFNRLAERYGLHVATTLTPIESVGSLTAGRINQTLAAIQQHDVQVIFAEPQFPADVIDLLSEEYDVTVMILDPLGDPNSANRAGYFQMMRYNLETLVAGLSRSERP